MRTNRLITVVDAHAGGDVSRVITAGAPLLRGETMLERMRDARERHDWLRRLLLGEPRGALHMCPTLPVAPVNAEADIGVVFMESMGYPAMSGSNAMCAATVVLETGMLAMRAPSTCLRLDTPAGVVPVTVTCEAGACREVRIGNVPSFATHVDEKLEVPGIGLLRVSVAYSGVFYAVVETTALGIALAATDRRRLVDLGRLVTDAAASRFPVSHPEIPELPGVEFTVFAAPLAASAGTGLVTTSAVFQRPDLICRSPTGTGTAARLAVLHARGEIGRGQRLENRSPIGTVFTGEITATGAVGCFDAVHADVWGSVHLTGVSQVLLDPDDPFPVGFTW